MAGTFGQADAMNLSGFARGAMAFDHWLQRFGPGTVVGSRAYILDRLHEFDEASVNEVVIADMETFACVLNPGVSAAGVVASCQRMHEEMVAAFD